MTFAKTWFETSSFLEVKIWWNEFTTSYLLETDLQANSWRSGGTFNSFTKSNLQESAFQSLSLSLFNQFYPTKSKGPSHMDNISKKLKLDHGGARNFQCFNKSSWWMWVY